MKLNKENIIKNLQLVQEQSPLVHNITNYVVMNNTANALLAVGASPVMAHAIEEMEAMVAIAGTLVINIGTLDAQWVEGMLAAGKAANKKGIPIILDPVGAGATPFRTKTCWEIIETCNPTIIRGNSSEIMALVNEGIQTKGVDSTMASDDAVTGAKELAKKTNSIVVISGATDYITDGTTTYTIENGHPLMPKVTGLGCTASALCGAFSVIENNTLEACTSAMAIMGIAGELAAEKATGPGTLQLHFLDALYSITAKEVSDLYKA
ncbi:hydroxyethylthiazole kinase [Neptunitalea lumnitzerae]|uniref:Hydroxyethylthiazole kinase n=1 Tax=Neptunitalea lumnitzerae TaxID=2965509 RepID=A0ABQ5MHP5_9FLAO|nr:hydroxyethylthiazole kinase [Neptunitalea sp. Y10]GLB48917.1 hydroxyethylthiazole kinase [Neptunitalea sp. Y10]